MTDAPVLLDISDGVARLTLNRPAASNAIDVALARALSDATAQIEEDHTIRVVLLTGQGARFCGGGDVHAFADAGDDLATALGAVIGALHPAVETLGRLGAPVVASVQGSAAGAGLALVAGADLVVAAESAKFVMAYTGIGLVPDGGSTWYLPRVVGLRRAVDLALTNRVLTADEALDWGLVSRVVADDRLEAETEALVATLASGPTRALAAAKRLLRDSPRVDLETQLAHEAGAMVAAGDTDDGREGVAAFVAKRRPEFTGR